MIPDSPNSFTFMRFPAPLFALTIVFVGYSLPAGGQSTPPDSAAADKKSPVLETVRVSEAQRRNAYRASETSTATKSLTPLLDVPQSVTVVTQRVIRDQAMSSMADVVRYVPGIVMGQGEGNRDAPTIRGNATTADFFVDGVRDDVQYLRDLYNVSSVEALKGSNAMIFGRGGGGGVLNRVTKQAGWEPVNDVVVTAGSFGDRRTTADFGRALSRALAARMNGMYQRSQSYRRGVSLERQGLSPAVTFFSLAKSFRANVQYEHFEDHRTADRGIPSVDGAPLRADPSAFFGDPALSFVDARVTAGSATLTRSSASGVSVRTHTRFAAYDKFYQNVLPGAVTPALQKVLLSAYNEGTRRQNLFNQTDLSVAARTGRVGHLLLLGGEIGRQVTDKFRNTGFFGNTATSELVPIANPVPRSAINFRQAASDADNHVTNTTRSVYAQEQIEVAPSLLLVGGLRYETFDLKLHNNRTDSTLRRKDIAVSPRAGVILKPRSELALYGSYSVSFLPSSGDQFSSLNAATQTLVPERFTNREAGIKWDAARDFSVTVAVYQLDRTNTRSLSPADPKRFVQTGRQRTNGGEIGVGGTVSPTWEIFGGVAVQDAYFPTATSAAKAGAKVPLVPRSTLSLWNKFRINSFSSIGAGIVSQSRTYTAIDNTVLLPAFTRLDGSIYVTRPARITAQLNVENILDARYFPTSSGNNNITPGSPRSFRFSLNTSY